MKTILLQLGNKLFESCYPIYFPLYAAYKALSDKAERRLFRQFVRPGMNVVDVGILESIRSTSQDLLETTAKCIRLNQARSTLSI
jgi:hypothetical protein